MFTCIPKCYLLKSGQTCHMNVKVETPYLTPFTKGAITDPLYRISTSQLFSMVFRNVCVITNALKSHFFSPKAFKHSP